MMTREYVDIDGNDVIDCIFRRCNHVEEAKAMVALIQRSRIETYTQTIINILKDNVNMLASCPCDKRAHYPLGY